jgi:ribosomal protein S6
MREYELTVIYDLAVAEAGGREASVDLLTSVITARGGQLLKVDHWGRRRMAYPIGRAIDGDYIITRVNLDPAQIAELETALRIDERVYRQLIVRADELPAPPPPREPRRAPEARTGGESAPAAAAPAAAAPAAAPAPAPAPAAAPATAEPAPAASAEPAPAASAEPAPAAPAANA